MTQQADMGSLTRWQDTRQRVTQQMERWQGGVERSIRRKPAEALVIAAVAGLIVGRLVHLFTRRARIRWQESHARG